MLTPASYRCNIAAFYYYRKRHPASRGPLFARTGVVCMADVKTLASSVLSGSDVISVPDTRRRWSISVGRKLERRYIKSRGAFALNKIRTPVSEKAGAYVALLPSVKKYSERHTLFPFYAPSCVCLFDWLVLRSRIRSEVVQLHTPGRMYREWKCTYSVCMPRCH